MKNNQMEAAVLTALKEFTVQKVPLPTVSEGEILIKVIACSVCGSDVRIFNHGNERVEYPSVIGHEMTGEIIEIGNGVKNFKVGDKIAVGADVPGMEDEWSKNGMGNLADINYAIGYQFAGGFAQYCLLNKMTVDFGPIEVIPEKIDPLHACLTEPLACCVNGLELCGITPGKTVLVIGGGPIGILICRAAKAFGASLVVLADTNNDRVAKATELGIENVYNNAEIDLEELANKLTGGRGFDAVLTACPSPKAQEDAVKMIAKRGVVNFFGGLPKGSSSIKIDSNQVHYRECFITGSHGSTPRQFKIALNLINNGQVEVGDLISHSFPLKDIDTAFETVSNYSGMKVVLLPNQ